MLKAPGDKRNTWGNGIIQIHITRACDLACIGCTQGSNLAGKPVVMNLSQFADACESLVDYYGVVGIFGGNPCIHPMFPEICAILENKIPFERRGLWSNNLNGHGRLCRRIFNPEVSNLNVHCNEAAYLEILHDWPEAHPKGLKDSRHSPPYVAMKDLNLSEETMWVAINECDINQNWSAMICSFRGELRAFFCELAGAQSMLYQNEIDYPDTGLSVERGWWQRPIEKWMLQVMKHCYECGIPIRGYGDLAVNGRLEQVSRTHQRIYQLKRPTGKNIQIVTKYQELGGEVPVVTNYIENGML